MKTKKTTSDPTDYSKLVKRIKPVEALPLKPTILVYGRPGTGKTTFGATLPKPILYLDLREDGTDSIKNVKGIDVLRIEKWIQLEQAYWFLVSGKHKYKSVVIDAVTEMQDLGIEKYRDDNNMLEDELLSQRVWGIVSGSMKTWLLNYRDLIRARDTTIEAVGFLAHDRTHDADDDGGESQLMPEVGPRLMPSVASHLCGMVKVVGYTYCREVKSKDKGDDKLKKKVEYRMRLAPHAYYTAKIRQPKEHYLPESIVNPTYDKIVDIINGKFQSKPAKRSK